MNAAAVTVGVDVHLFLMVTAAAAPVLHRVEIHASLEVAAAAAPHWEVIVAAAVAHWQVLRCACLVWRGWAVAPAKLPCVYGITAPGTGDQHESQEQSCEQIFWRCVDDE